MRPISRIGEGYEERGTPGWMLAHEENGALTSKLIRETCLRQGIEPSSLTRHADRG